MKLSSIISTVFLFVIFAFSSSQPSSVVNAKYVPALRSAINLNTDEYVPDEVLVQFDNSVTTSQIDTYLHDLQAEPFSDIKKIGVLVIKVQPGQVEDSIKYLQNQPGVMVAEPNFIAYALDTYPNDPDYPQQYGLAAIHAPQAWDMSTGASWVTIAIIDSGVDQTHPDLITKTIAGYDFVNNDTDPQDDYGHGTHVAGIAAAASNNGEGIAGVSWGATIMPIKVLNASGNGTYANVASGIIWAVDHGAQVINLSLGGASPSTVLENAVNYAYTHGVIQVAATGNSGGGSVYYPARYDQVVGVAATDKNNNHSNFSNFGTGVDLAAPGESIYSLSPGGGYIIRSGTSMAAPFVSGLAAILIGLPGNYDAGLVERQMESSALDLGSNGWDAYYGFGLIQMDIAIHLVPATKTPTITLTTTVTPSMTPTTTETPTPTSTFTSTQHPTITSTITLIPINTPNIVRHPTATDSISWSLWFFGTSTMTPVITTQIEKTSIPIESTSSIISNIPSASKTSQPKILPDLIAQPKEDNNWFNMLPFLSCCFISFGILLFAYSLLLLPRKRA